MTGPVLTSDNGLDHVRTPDDRFAALPLYEYEPSYREWQGLRMAHVDVGEGPPVIFVHGEPTWGFLWRKVLPPVLEAGYRCIVPDHAGFGRSDKPIDLGWYTYDRHVAAFHDLLEQLDLQDATVVVHDWGGPIGLRVAVEAPGRISRIVAMDTGFFTGEQEMSDAWKAFHNFVAETEDLPIGMLVGGGAQSELPDEIIAAYEAPFPAAEYKAGSRAFPLILPTTPDAPGAAEGRAVGAALATDPRPKLVLWADADPIIPFQVGERFAEAINAAPPVKIPGSSHFLQEDNGELIGRHIADWLHSTTPAPA